MKLPKLVKLKRVATFVGGSTPLRDRPEYFGGGIPWVKTTDLNNGKIVTTEETLSTHGLDASSCKVIASGAVLVAMYGGFKQIGRTGLLTQPSAINQALTAIQPDVLKLDPQFLMEWLNFRVGYWKRFAGSSRKDPNITKSDVADFLVPLFDLLQQKAVVKLLTEWDKAVESATLLHAAKNQRKQGLMQQLLTGRRRLKGFKGKWKLLRADKLFTEISVRNQASEERLLSVTQDRGVIPRDMLVGRVTMPAGTVDAFKLVERDNFVISLRSFQGGLEHSAYRGLVSPAYTVLQASDEIHPAFFRHYFKSTDFVKRLSVAVVGIRDGKQISYIDFRSIKLPLPPVQEQIALNELLDLADRDIALCRGRLASLQLQKRALMQKLLSGEWRLPEKAATGKSSSKKGLQTNKTGRKQLLNK